MRTVNVHQAKTTLSKLIKEVVTTGQGVVIARAGKPVVKVVPLDAGVTKRELGTLRGHLVVGDDFDAALPDEVISEFEHGS